VKVLVALGVRDAWALVEHTIRMLQPTALDLLLVYVVDEEHHQHVLRLPGGLGRRHEPHETRRHGLAQAEDQAGGKSLGRGVEAVLDSGISLEHVDRRLVRGRPAQAVVELAEDEGCDLIVVRARDEVHVRMPAGPASVGHTARFILDHAPCDVLLIRA
jgi:nucleotide-binding universal stress UspA family protein